MKAIFAYIEYNLAEAVLAVVMAKRTKRVIDIDLVIIDVHAFDMRVYKNDNCILAVELVQVDTDQG